jgi:hypothetical protein
MGVAGTDDEFHETILRILYVEDKFICTPIIAQPDVFFNEKPAIP